MQSPLLGATYPKNSKAFQLKSAINQIEALEQGMEAVRRKGAINHLPLTELSHTQAAEGWFGVGLVFVVPAGCGCECGWWEHNESEWQKSVDSVK